MDQAGKILGYAIRQSSTSHPKQVSLSPRAVLGINCNYQCYVTSSPDPDFLDLIISSTKNFTVIEIHDVVGVQLTENNTIGDFQRGMHCGWYTGLSQHTMHAH